MSCFLCFLIIDTTIVPNIVVIIVSNWWFFKIGRQIPDGWVHCRCFVVYIITLFSYLPESLTCTHWVRLYSGFLFWYVMSRTQRLVFHGFVPRFLVIWKTKLRTVSCRGTVLGLVLTETVLLADFFLSHEFPSHISTQLDIGYILRDFIEVFNSLCYILLMVFVSLYSLKKILCLMSWVLLFSVEKEDLSLWLRFLDNTVAIPVTIFSLQLVFIL